MGQCIFDLWRHLKRLKQCLPFCNGKNQAINRHCILRAILELNCNAIANKTANQSVSRIFIVSFSVCIPFLFSSHHTPAESNVLHVGILINTTDWTDWLLGDKAQYYIQENGTHLIQAHYKYKKVEHRKCRKTRKWTQQRQRRCGNDIENNASVMMNMCDYLNTDIDDIETDDVSDISISDLYENPEPVHIIPGGESSPPVPVNVPPPQCGEDCHSSSSSSRSTVNEQPEGHTQSHGSHAYSSSKHYHSYYHDGDHDNDDDDNDDGRLPMIVNEGGIDFYQQQQQQQQQQQYQQTRLSPLQPYQPQPQAQQQQKQMQMQVAPYVRDDDDDDNDEDQDDEALLLTPRVVIDGARHHSLNVQPMVALAAPRPRLSNNLEYNSKHRIAHGNAQTLRSEKRHSYNPQCGQVRLSNANVASDTNNAEHRRKSNNLLLQTNSHKRDGSRRIRRSNPDLNHHHHRRGDKHAARSQSPTKKSKQPKRDRHGHKTRDRYPATYNRKMAIYETSSMPEQRDLSFIHFPLDVLVSTCAFLTVCDLKALQVSCSTFAGVGTLPKSKRVALKQIAGFQANIRASILCVASHFHRDREPPHTSMNDVSELAFKLHDIAKYLAQYDEQDKAFKKSVRKLLRTGVLTKIIRLMSDSKTLSVQEQCLWIVKKILKSSEAFAAKLVCRGALDSYLKLFYANDPMFTHKVLRALKKLLQFEWMQSQLIANKMFKQIIAKYFEQQLCFGFEGTDATNVVQNSAYIDNCVELVSYLYLHNLYYPEWNEVVTLFPIIVRLLLSKRISDVDVMRHLLGTIAKISHSDLNRTQHIRLLLSYSVQLVSFLLQLLQCTIHDNDICCSVMNVIGNTVRYDEEDNYNGGGEVQQQQQQHQQQHPQQQQQQHVHNRSPFVEQATHSQFIDLLIKNGLMERMKPFLSHVANARIKQETLRVLVNLLNHGNSYQIAFILSHAWVHKKVADVCVEDTDPNTLKFGVVYLFTALKLINDKRIMATPNVIAAFIHLLHVERHHSNQILFAALRGLNSFYPTQIGYTTHDQQLTIYISKLIRQSDGCIATLREIEQNSKLNAKTRNLASTIHKNVSIHSFLPTQ